MTTPAMRKVELHVLDADLVPVLAYLGHQECMQIARPEGATPPAGELRWIFDNLQILRRYLNLPDIEGIGERTQPPDSAALVEARELVSRGEALRARETGWRGRLEQLSAARQEAAAFAGLDLPFKDLAKVSFLVLRCGRLGQAGRASLAAGMGERAVVLDNPHGGVMVLASRKARFALDNELARAGFVAADPPADQPGLPRELLEALDGERSGIEAALADLALERQAFAAASAGRLPDLLAAFAMGAMIEDLGSGLESTARVRRLEGWMPAARIERVAAGLDGLCGGRVAIRVYEPAELVAVRAGREQVPVELRHGRLVSSFERLVVSYGTPLYGTIDPTPFVAFSFILLFALMFGDLGQGALILAAGCLLAAGWPRRLARFQGFAPILQAVGGASMATGLLYGSVFSADSLLVPATRAVTGLFGQPMDRLVSLLPTEGFGRLLAFFAFTVGVGAALNSLGLAINMVNRWRLGQRREALFGKTGLAGALFFWYGLGFGLRLVLGGPVGWADSIGFLLPLAGLLFGAELWDRLAGRHPAGEGGAVGKVVDIVEALSYYLSNTVSFLRVGAFALAHAVLSFSVFTLSSLVADVALGPLWSILVIVAGNLVILVLEGMIVAIQVTRLQYYEFFSKFFAETGREFRPFRFTYGGAS